MKKLIVSFLAVLWVFDANAQGVPTPADAQAVINSNIKTNGVGAINGIVLNGVLTQMLSALAGYTDSSFTNRNVIAGTGLTGGGSLANDVTLSVAANALNALDFTSTGGTSSRTIPSKSGDTLSVLDFGIVPNLPSAASSNHTNFVIASATNRKILIPAGNYYVAGAIPFGGPNGGQFVGEGIKSTVITETVTNSPAFQGNDNSVGCGVSDMTIVHSGTPIAGGVGIDSGNYTNFCTYANLDLYGNYRGFQGHSSPFGTLQNVTAELSVDDGMWFSNTAGYTANNGLGWNLNSVLSQANGDAGVRFVANAVTGLPTIALLPLVNVQTFANADQGLIITGNATTGIGDIIINGGFFGSDGLSEIYIDAYQDVLATNIRGVTTEINHAGNTIYITANNTYVNISDAQVDAMPVGAVGIYSNAPNTIVSNPKVYGQSDSGSIGVQLVGTNSGVIGGSVTRSGTGVNIQGSNSYEIYTNLCGNTTTTTFLAGTNVQYANSCHP